MARKCKFCRYERGPRKRRCDACKSCVDYSNFEVNSRMTSGQEYLYRKYIEREAWANDHSVQYDRATALAVLKALSKDMYPSVNLYGNKTLVIGRDEFEFIRKKFLG